MIRKIDGSFDSCNSYKRLVLFHVWNLSVLNFRMFVLMYPGSISSIDQCRAPAESYTSVPHPALTARPTDLPGWTPHTAALNGAVSTAHRPPCSALPAVPQRPGGVARS